MCRMHARASHVQSGDEIDHTSRYSLGAKLYFRERVHGVLRYS